MTVCLGTTNLTKVLRKFIKNDPVETPPGGSPGPSELGWVTNTGRAYDERYWTNYPIQPRAQMPNIYVLDMQVDSNQERSDTFEKDGKLFFPAGRSVYDLDTLKREAYAEVDGRAHYSAFPNAYPGNGDYAFNANFNSEPFRVNIHTLEVEKLPHPLSLNGEQVYLEGIWVTPENQIMGFWEGDDRNEDGVYPIHRVLIDWQSEDAPTYTRLPDFAPETYFGTWWTFNGQQHFFFSSEKHYFFSYYQSVFCFDRETHEFMWGQEFDSYWNHPGVGLSMNNNFQSVKIMQNGNLAFFAETVVGDFYDEEMTVFVEVAAETGQVVKTTKIQLPAGESLEDVLSFTLSEDEKKVVFVGEPSRAYVGRMLIISTETGEVLADKDFSEYGTSEKVQQIIYSPTSNIAVYPLDLELAFANLNTNEITIAESGGTDLPVLGRHGLSVTSQGDYIWVEHYGDAVLALTDRELLLPQINKPTPGLNNVGTPITPGTHLIGVDGLYQPPYYTISFYNPPYKMRVNGVAGVYLTEISSKTVDGVSMGTLSIGSFEDGLVVPVKEVTWNRTAHGHPTTYWGNKVLLERTSGRLAEFVLNIDTGEVLPTTNPPVLYSVGGGFVSVGDTLYAMGVRHTSSGPTDSMWKLDENLVWTKIADKANTTAPSPRLNAVGPDGCIYTFFTTSFYATNQQAFRKYVPATNTWTDLTVPPIGDSMFFSRNPDHYIWGNKIYYFYHEAYTYDIVEEKWEKLPSLPDEQRYSSLLGSLNVGPIWGIEGPLIYAHEGATIPF